mmetsp:Transcript_93381/g.166091  ORF Transcript_93381/g.166091 Transcript_93381/m.166091 type:complete len:218 (+) Transcript_93381:1007-1660(+)
MARHSGPPCRALGSRMPRLAGAQLRCSGPLRRALESAPRKTHQKAPGAVLPRSGLLCRVPEATCCMEALQMAHFLLAGARQHFLKAYLRMKARGLVGKFKLRLMDESTIIMLHLQQASGRCREISVKFLASGWRFQRAMAAVTGTTGVWAALLGQTPGNAAACTRPPWMETFSTCSSMRLLMASAMLWTKRDVLLCTAHALLDKQKLHYCYCRARLV